MHNRRFKALLGLNIGLVVLLASITILPGVVSGRARPYEVQPARVRGDYTMVSGKTTSGTTHAIYILDGANQEILALRWDARQKIIPVGYRSLDNDSKQQPGR